MPVTKDKLATPKVTATDTKSTAKNMPEFVPTPQAKTTEPQAKTTEPQAKTTEPQAKTTESETKKPETKKCLSFISVPFTALLENVNNVREDYGDLTSLIQAAAIDIQSIEPLRVFPKNPEGKYLIDRGHRRYSAIQQAISKGLLLTNVSVPVIVDASLTPEKNLLGQISSNTTKKYTPVEQYNVIAQLVELGKTKEQISDILKALSLKAIQLYVALATFHDQWLRDAALSYDVMSLTTACKLAYLEELANEQGIWPELKKTIESHYEKTCKRISESQIFGWLDQLRSSKPTSDTSSESDDTPLPEGTQVEIIPTKHYDAILVALTTNNIGSDTLQWLLDRANINIEQAKHG